MDYSISEQYTLPSLGKVYDKEIDPIVKLRSMTTQDEIKRLGHSDRPYKIMADVIDDCLLTKPGISSYDMCLGDYQFLLHKLRIVTYGPKYTLQLTCPHCYVTEEATIDLESLQVNQYDEEELKKYIEFDLPVTKKHIKIRMQTPRILDDIAIKVKDFKRKRQDFQGDSAFFFNLASFIDTVDSEKMNEMRLEEFLKNLPMKDTNYIMQCADKLIQKVGINTKLLNTCDVCGADFQSSFRFTGEFFGPSIDE